MEFDKLMEYLRLEKPELYRGLEIIKAAPIPVVITILEVKTLYRAVQKIVEETLSMFEKESNESDWRIHQKPSTSECFEDFCIRQEEKRTMLHTYELAGNSNKKEIAVMAEGNVAKMMPWAQALSNKQQQEEGSNKKVPQDVAVTDILKNISEKAIRLRCPFLAHSRTFEEADIKKLIKAKKPDANVEVPNYPEARCILGNHKPLACLLHGLDTEMLYIGADLMSANVPMGELVYLPIVEALQEQEPDLVPVLKRIAVSAPTSVSTSLMEEPMKKKGLL